MNCQKALPILLLLFITLNTKANILLQNNFEFLQDITFELFDGKVIERNVPENNKSIEEILMFDILNAFWKDNKWVAYTTNKALLGKYKVGSPTMFEDSMGRKMFFVANFPGTKGGTDLYVSEFINGAWTRPKNMGSNVNTVNNESNTGMLNESTLTFSSDGIIKKLNINSFRVEGILGNQETTTNYTTEYIDYSAKYNTNNNVNNNTNTNTNKNTSTNTNNVNNNTNTSNNTNVNNTSNNEVIVKTNKKNTKQKPIPTWVQSFGVRSTADMKNLFPNAIQIGSYINPNWNIIKQFYNVGNLVTYINEFNLNAVWLTGYISEGEVNEALLKVKQYPSFEDSFLVK